MRKTVFGYGMAGGVISIMLAMINWHLIARNLGYDASQVAGYVSIFIALLCIPLGLRYFRDTSNIGQLSFVQGLKIGIGITSITALIMGLYSVGFFQFSGEVFQEWRKKYFTADELAEAQQQLDQMPEFVMDPWFQGLLMFVIVILMGSIITLISALILKRGSVTST